MNKKLVWITVGICLTVGLFLFGIGVFMQWETYSKADYSNSIIIWLKSPEGLLILGVAVETFAINLISSIVFLIAVDFVIDRNVKRVEKRLSLEKTERDVLTLIRTDPQEALRIIHVDVANYHILAGQFLGGCDFSNLILDGLDLSGADLHGVKLTSTSLIGTNLTNCNLSQTDFSNSNLAKAILFGAKVDEEKLKQAYSLRETIMPNGEKYNGEYGLLGDAAEAKKLNIDLKNEDGKIAYYGIHKNGV